MQADLRSADFVRVAERLAELAPADDGSGSSDDGRDSRSPQRGITHDFDDGDEYDSMSSSSVSRSVSGRASLVAAINVHATLSRAALLSMRPAGADGLSLPDYRLVQVDSIQRPADVLCMMSAGDRVRDAAVWQQLASGWTMLPAVRVEDRAERACFFGCGRRVSAGAPVVNLLHVCDTAGARQHVQLSVHTACDNCARARTTPVGMRARVRQPLRTVPRTFVIERMTVFLTFVLARLQDVAARYRVDVVQPESMCDSCGRRLDDTRDAPTLVAAERAETGELMLFVMCSHQCETDFRQMLEARLRPQQPRGLRGERLEPTWSNPALPEITLRANAYDDPFRDLKLLTPDAVDRLVQSKASAADGMGIPSGTVVHRCSSTRCFCRYTHRGRTPRQASQLDDTFLIEQIYAMLTTYHVYTDILGSADDARCAGCKAPCESTCAICLCTRFCSDACQRKFPAAAALHRNACRPHADAWTPLQLR